MGDITTIERFNGYTLVDGVMMPSKYQLQSTIYSIEFDLQHQINQPVQEAAFRPAGL
jgi:hypothetical protein